MRYFARKNFSSRPVFNILQTSGGRGVLDKNAESSRNGKFAKSALVVNGSAADRSEMQVPRLALRMTALRRKARSEPLRVDGYEREAECEERIAL